MAQNSKDSAKKRVKAKKSVVGNRGKSKTVAKRKAPRKRRRKPTPNTKSMSQTKTAKNGSSQKPKEEEDFETRMKKRDAERARKREERRRKVRRQKIMLAVSVGVIFTSVGIIVIFCLPSVRMSISLAKADKYAAQEDYESSQSAYEDVLQMDASFVEAYRGMADNYVKQGKIIEAEEILYKGWEQTQDEGLLHYYCIEVHNEAVTEVNEENCTFSTLDKFIQVLELEPDNKDTIEALQACYERLFKVSDEEDTCLIFFDEDTSQDTCSYGEYEQLLRRLLAVYELSPSDGLGDILEQYALIDMPYVRISIPHLEQYIALLEDIDGKVHSADIEETIACLNRAKEIEDYFATAFAEFESGNYAYARELVAEESYQQIRDSFIGENSGYWEGSIYIPVNKEQLVLHREEDKVRFFFLDDADYTNHYGIITVWGTKQEDDGVQRSAISYEPVEETGADSHTEYTVQYLYSNVKIRGQYVPQMNYRFDTKVTTEEGITTNAIGDWGGEHEFEIDY